MIAVHRWRNNPPASWWDLAGKIPNKTLVIGATESYLPQERVKEISRRIPHATFTAVEGFARVPRGAAEQVSGRRRAVHLLFREVAAPTPPILVGMSASVPARPGAATDSELRRAFAKNGIPRDPDPNEPLPKRILKSKLFWLSVVMVLTYATLPPKTYCHSFACLRGIYRFPSVLCSCECSGDRRPRPSSMRR